jgi:predicted polyphosphate/ATP-dependent NAD kinase
MQIKIGFIINPIAGMGGRVGLKGTDGVLKKAIELGAKPISPKKAHEMLKEFTSNFSNGEITWYTSKGIMGSNQLENVGIKNIDIIYETTKTDTSAEDTKKICEKFLEKKVDLILFCGGDGTARDIFEIIGNKIPILGIPSGVKMHSGAFGINISATAKILKDFIKNDLTIGEIEIMDLDEELYREGQWNIRLFGIAKGIVEPTYIQVGKSFYDTITDEEIKDELAEHIIEEIEEKNDFLYLFGSGGTIDYIAKKINLDNTLLGIDAIYNKKIVGKDLNENKILKLLKKYQKVKLILSPIGAQGFILGRGNLQLSPEVIKKIGTENIIVISTPSKLANTPFIRVDTGDRKLDKEFAELGYIMVVTGYRFSRVVKIQTNNF